MPSHTPPPLPQSAVCPLEDQANVSKHLKVLAQANIVSREQQGVSVYYQICNPFIFELCDLVCNSLVVQFQQQTAHLEELAAFRNP